PSRSDYCLFVLTLAQQVHARVRVVGAPVEPVVFERRDFLKSSARERARRGAAGEVPRASGLGINECGRILAAEEFEGAAVEPPVEDAHALAVLGEEDE